MGARILIVDDEESIRCTFEIFLTEIGHQVVSAANFEEALAAVEAQDFDLVFLDIVLEGKTGIDLLKALRESQRSLLVIMITGVPSVETATEAFRLGAHDYIIKPIREEALLRATERALRHKALQEEKNLCRLNYEAVFRSVNDGLISVDENMDIIEINHAAETICGFERSEVEGKPVARLADRCEGNCLGILTEAFSEKKPVKLHYVECRNAEGARQIISVTASPLLDAQKTFTGAVVVIRDETRLVNLERRLVVRRKIDSIVGRSAGIEKLRALITDLADVRSTVLITGESGTGKELVVDALHHGGDRQDGPLVKVNCSALTENLLESELFGHVAGAFTGAWKDKEGRFQRADGGTLFLDEIGEISPRMQLRLLRVIETMAFERVGESKTIRVDVRIVAATNRDLEAQVAQGLFREDLYYRLKVAQVHLPPLRERREDIPLLVEHFRRKLGTRFDKEINGVSAEAERMLLAYDWPGNIRELENLLEYCFIRCRGHVITVADLPQDFQQRFQPPPFFLDEEMSDAAEAAAIRRALAESGGNKTEAARLLGISRRTIYRKMEKHGMPTGD